MQNFVAHEMHVQQNLRAYHEDNLGAVVEELM